MLLRSLTVFFLLSIANFAQTLAQEIVESYQDHKSSAKFDLLNDQFGKFKQLPEGYELQALLALSHYPELKEVKVKFKKRKSGAPFVSRPTIWSTLFRRSDRRKYIIFIRTKEHELFSPILLNNMPFDAQVGVLGHELAHSVDFKSRGFFKMLQVTFGNLSWRFLDKFEFATDRRAINHGLGFQLLSWSEHAVKTLRINEPAALEPSDKIKGIVERERYMRPETIKNEIKSLKQYSKFIHSSRLK